MLYFITRELLIKTNTVSILNQSCFLSDPGSEHTLGGQTPLRSPLMLKMKWALCHRPSSARADGWTARLEARTKSERNREKHIREWQNFLSINPCSQTPYNLTILDKCNCQQSNCRHDDSDWKWFGPHVTLVMVIFLSQVIWAPNKSQESFPFV